MTEIVAGYHVPSIALLAVQLAVVFYTANVYMRRALGRAREGQGATGWMLGTVWVIGTGAWVTLFAGTLGTQAGYAVMPDPLLTVFALVALLGTSWGAVALIRDHLVLLSGPVLALGYMIGGLAIFTGLQLSFAGELRWEYVTAGALIATAGGLVACLGTLRPGTESWRAPLQSAVAGAVGFWLGGFLLAESLAVEVPRFGERVPTWVGPVLLLGVIGQCALLLLLAWVEARMHASQQATLSAVEEANAHLRREVAQRAEVASALTESEERFRQAFDASPVGMSILDARRRWVQVNQAMCAFLGYSKEELLARTFEDVTHPDDLGGTVEGLRELETWSQRPLRAGEALPPGRRRGGVRPARDFSHSGERWAANRVRGACARHHRAQACRGYACGGRSAFPLGLRERAGGHGDGPPRGAVPAREPGAV